MCVYVCIYKYVCVNFVNHRQMDIFGLTGIKQSFLLTSELISFFNSNFFSNLFRNNAKWAGTIVQLVESLPYMQPTRVQSLASQIVSQAMPGAIPDCGDRSNP